LRGPLPGFQAVRPGNKFSPAAPTTHIHYRRMPEIRQSKSLIQSSSQLSESRRTAGWEKGDGGLGFVVSLPERFHASCVDGRIYESSRVTPEARPTSYLQITGGFYIAAGAHRFSQRSFLAEDRRSKFVVAPVPKSEGPGAPSAWFEKSYWDPGHPPPSFITHGDLRHPPTLF